MLREPSERNGNPQPQGPQQADARTGAGWAAGGGEGVQGRQPHGCAAHAPVDSSIYPLSIGCAMHPCITTLDLRCTIEPEGLCSWILLTPLHCTPLYPHAACPFYSMCHASPQRAAGFLVLHCIALVGALPGKGGDR